MKIKNLKKEELISNLKLFSNTTPTAAHHPEIPCAVDHPEYLLLGGGFQVLDEPAGSGNLGTGSFPDSNFSWFARSKDHYDPVSCRITAYASGIRATLKKAGSDFGTVITSFHSHEDVDDLYKSTADPLPDMAMCGGGGASHYGKVGIYLHALEPIHKLDQTPPKQSFTVQATFVRGSFVDLEEGKPTAYAMGIKVIPAPSQPPGSGTGGEPQTPSTECNKKLGITDIKSTGDRPTFSASNAIDNDPTGTKWWSTSVANPSITLNLGAIKQVCKVEIIWGDATQYQFTISFSTDNNTYTNVTQLTRTSTSTTQAEPYTFPVTQAQYVKITITQSVTTYAQISDISVFSNQS
jgi:hypothetical protein